MKRWNLGPRVHVAALAAALVLAGCSSTQGATVSFVTQAASPGATTQSRSAIRPGTQQHSATSTASSTSTPTPTQTATPTATAVPPTATPPLPTPTPIPTTSPPTAPATAPPSAAGIYAVGDSVMLGAASYLEADGITVVAEESHTWDWGVSVVQGWAAQGIHPSILVVHLGNNSAVSSSDFDAMMSAAGSAQVYFVTLYEPSLAAHQSEVNGAIEAGVSRYSNAHLIDWDSVAAGAVCSDGIHISCGGAPTYVSLILASI